VAAAARQAAQLEAEAAAAAAREAERREAEAAAARVAAAAAAQARPDPDLQRYLEWAAGKGVEQQAAQSMLSLFAQQDIASYASAAGQRAIREAQQMIRESMQAAGGIEAVGNAPARVEPAIEPGTQAAACPPSLQLLPLSWIPFEPYPELSFHAYTVSRVCPALLQSNEICARESGALPAAAVMEPEPEHAAEMVAAEGTLARCRHSRYAP
jgi:hypothetical protein